MNNKTQQLNYVTVNNSKQIDFTEDKLLHRVYAYVWINGFSMRRWRNKKPIAHPHRQFEGVIKPNLCSRVECTGFQMMMPFICSPTRFLAYIRMYGSFFAFSVYLLVRPPPPYVYIYIMDCNACGYCRNVPPVCEWKN